MRITKYEHATLTATKGDRHIIIDPGSFLASLTDFSDVEAIVITHEHPDHWVPGHVRRIHEANPEAPVYTTQAVADALRADGIEVPVVVVSPGEVYTQGDFTLEFFGGRHAVIHESIPVVDNVGVLVDNELYYPGDSFAVPEGREIAVLAAPIGAPWLKVSEAIDYVLAVAPKRAFGTHDMTLSVVGRDMHRGRLQWATEQNGGTFYPLDPTESIDS